jgi:signal transduction histidine kinase
MNTMLTNLGEQPVITYEWLSKMENNGKYAIGIYDKNTALSFLRISKNKQEQALFQEALEYARPSFSAGENSLSSSHYEFRFLSSDKRNYYVCFAVIKTANGSFEIVILYSIRELQEQLFRQRMLFLLLNLLSLIIISVFSWHYTNHLLKPIEMNQKKQVQFVAAASHELRTPLSVILFSLSALKKADETQKEVFLQTMTTEGYQMSRLINDMLVLANADNKTWNIQKEDVELDTLVLETFEAFCPLAKEKDISLFVKLPEASLPRCHCDKQRIGQVLSILLHNAISYGKKGDHVDLSLNKGITHFALTVTDHGTGIADKDKPYVFDRFYRTDSSRSTKEHFGLGLSIAKEIVDAHNGTIRLEDTIGGGATFTVLLPL